ncbi:MAG: hypothetical protein FJW31_30960, partial [Acidobacteria bacterium]|nr:hypothetical protein [Acidobacteriota bacterium]
MHLVDPAVLGTVMSHSDASQNLLPRCAFRFMDPTDARGSLGRNTFRRARIGNVNASLNRTFTLRQELRLTIGVESINLFNTPQFAEPTKELAAPVPHPIVWTHLCSCCNRLKVLAAGLGWGAVPQFSNQPLLVV